MSLLIQVLIVTIPPLAVFLTAYYMLRSYFDHVQKKTEIDSKRENQQIIVPVKLQAYERLILFLERISPESLIMRVNKPGESSKQLQGEMLANIRAEFEHNLAQQIYVSAKAWEIIKSAKNNTIKIINTASDHVDPSSPSLQLSQKIIEMAMKMERTPTG
ncbi:MAG: hypothetical protein ACOCUL_01345, partial [Bacteroidota bacterium]